MRNNLWGTITYGQNLDVKELTGRNFDGKGPKRDETTSAYRHGLDHDYPIGIVDARLDVTRVLWKTSPVRDIVAI